METPYARLLNQPLAAPLSEMVDIIVAALSSQQYARFSYFEFPPEIQASRQVAETWGMKNFSKDYSVEVTWKENPHPPHDFIEFANGNPHLNPVLLTIRLKQHKAQSQENAGSKAAELWEELKQRALDTAEALRTRPPITDHGTARFATAVDLENEGYFGDDTTEDTSKRFRIGFFDERPLSVPVRLTEAHTIVAGPPGVGKSRSVFIPNLIERVNTSAIVTEVVAGEDILPTVYSRTAGYRKENGHKIFYLNPSDVANSTRFNPLDLINDVGDAIRYATLIITNTTFKFHSGDQIWTQAETHLLTSLLLYAWGLGGKKRSVEGGKCNLGYIRYILRLGPLKLQEEINQDGIQQAKDQFNEFLVNSSPNFRLGVFSGLIQRLNPWLNPVVVKLTEVSDFSPEDLRKHLFTFYLAYAVNRKDYRPIMALALNYLINFPLKNSPEKPLTLLLDEFAAYGYVPDIDDVQATIRNKGIGMAFGFQDQQQLTKVYSQSEAEVIFTNTDTKLIFATGSYRTQQQVSQSIGQTTKVRKQVSSNAQITRQTYGAPLVEPAEVGRIPDGNVLVVRNKRFPIMARTIPPGTYEHYFTDYPPPQAPLKAIEPETFEQCEKAKELEYSKTEAAQQVATFKARFNEMQAAASAYHVAVEKNLSAQTLAELKKKRDDAKKSYDELLEEPEVTLLPIAEAQAQLQQAPPPVAASEPAAEVQPEEAVDPFSEMYDDSGDDPNDPFYVFDDK